MFGFKKRERRSERHRAWLPEILLMASVFALLLLRFPGILQDAPLPNWDAVGHFAALQEMTRYLAHGHITGYLTSWFGGMPLFQFYAPLFFIVTIAVWSAMFKLVSLALVFRAMTLLAVFAAVPALWFFAATFFGRREARWALALSPLFLFYPKALSTFGAGAAAAFYVGLIPNALGLALLLAWPAVLERWKRAPSSRAWAAAAVLVPAALALTHTLSFIFGLALMALWAFSGLRGAAMFRRFVCSGVAAFGLAAFWLVPFVLTSGYTIGEARAIPLMSQLLALFPFNIWLMQPVVIAESLLLAGGLIVAWRRGFRHMLFMYGGLIVIILTQDAWTALWPGLGIHYYRLIPIILLLQLAFAALTIASVWERWGEQIARLRAYIVTAVAILVAISFFGAFANQVSNPEIIGPGIPWRTEQFSDTAEVTPVISWLGQQQDVGRVDFELPSVEILHRLGSLSYLSSRLMIENGQGSTGGLYLEDAPLYPYITPADATTLAGDALVDETQHLRWLIPFAEQPPAVQLDRLRSLGVTHVVAVTEGYKVRLAELTGTAPVMATPAFSVFRLAGARAMAAVAPVRPALFLSSYGPLRFRDLATALFAGKQTYDFPVAERRGDVRQLTSEELSSFSFLIVDGTRLDEADRAALAAAGKPVVTLGGESVIGNGPFIAAFAPLKNSRHSMVKDWPIGWPELWTAVASLKEPNPEAAAPVTLEQSDDRTMVVHGRGPILVNFGYFPYWQTEPGSTARVYRVAPDLMLVFPDASGMVRLTYRPDRAARAAQVVSLITLLAVAAWLAWPLAKRRRYKSV